MFVEFIIVLAKAGLVLFALLNLAGLLTWAERKQSAVMQDRVGPNRANIGKLTLGGLLHPVADGIKTQRTKTCLGPKRHPACPFPIRALKWQIL